MYGRGGGGVNGLQTACVLCTRSLRIKEYHRVSLYERLILTDLGPFMNGGHSIQDQLINGGPGGHSGWALNLKIGTLMEFYGEILKFGSIHLHL